MSFHEDTDHDSTLGDEENESTQSLSSSRLAYEFENGRRYHAFRAGQYFMPNDEVEQEAMDLLHHICQLILRGKNYVAPVVDPMAVLDIGTGTGIWAIDVADQFPAAQVIATDLSPIQPDWIPTNLQFQIDDCESDWTFGRKFDFIHIRHMAGSVADWPALLQRCLNQLNPGGWIECSNVAFAQLHPGIQHSTPAIHKWLESLETAGHKTGRSLIIAPKIERLIHDAGFIQVKDYQYEISVVSCAQDERLAPLFKYLMLMEVEGVSLRLFTQVLRWSIEETQALLADVRRELSSPDLRMSTKMHFVVGRKPQR